LDVSLPAIQLIDLRLVGIESGDAVPGLGKPQPQRQPHVSAPNNPHAELRALEIFRSAIGWHRSRLCSYKNLYSNAIVLAESALQFLEFKVTPPIILFMEWNDAFGNKAG